MLLDKCTSERVLLEADLVPLQGQRFQPTGFANLGAAVYTLPNGTRMLLVESVQSMANRLERTITQPDGTVIPELAGISYVKAVLQCKGKEDICTSSLLEAHRLASPFIIADKNFQDEFCNIANYDENKPLDWSSIHKAIFKYDVNSLLHGIFLSNVRGGRIKVPRLISAFIEAKNIREAISGGVKNTFDPRGCLQHKDCTDKKVYGNVIYPRTEYTAERIIAYFNLDVDGIRTLGIEEEAQELLYCLALYKVRRLLDRGLRLRTACDLKISGEPHVNGIDELPDEESLLKNLKESIKNCAPLFSDPPVTLLNEPVKENKESKGHNTIDEGEE